MFACTCCPCCQCKSEVDINDDAGEKEKLTKKSDTNETTDGSKHQKALVEENKANSKPTAEGEVDNQLSLVEITNNFLTEGIPDFWADGIQMQNAYSLEAKGWKVQIAWRESTITGAGTGCFVEEDVNKGQLLRVAQTGKNLIRLREESDLPKNMSSITKNYFSNSCAQIDDFVFILVPGNGFNHSSDPNVEAIVADEETLHVLAVKDMKAETELSWNHDTFGEPPQYLKEFAKNEEIELVFSGKNANK